LAAGVQGQITNFPQADIAKPLYPGVRGTWYELADDKDSQDALALLPEHLHGLLVEGGCVQFCRPSSIRYKHAGWVQPLQGLLQVLVVRAVDLRKSSNPSWSKPFWTPERWQQVCICAQQCCMHGSCSSLCVSMLGGPYVLVGSGAL
jgi:hypothetical protein